MNYSETLDFLYKNLPMFQRTGKAAYKADLKNTYALDNILDHPHRNFKTIHIAGTNGKGSVSHMLASVLQTAGYKTGLYTSPHLIDFRERIRINGRMIPEEQVTEFVGRIKKSIYEIEPSFFEITVAMALDFFSRERTDIAVIETGMGGRLDSTNIITPELSIITNISLDHTEFLGDTIAKIAAEKGGIIKKGIPLITGTMHQEALSVIARISKEREAPHTQSEARREFQFQTLTNENISVFHYRNQHTNNTEAFYSDLGGAYQAENLSTAIAATEVLKERGITMDEKDIDAGLRNVKSLTGLRGRWEILGANPRIIADTAHNPAGIKSVLTQVMNIPCKKLHIVWGMVSDKQPEKIFPLLPLHAEYYFTQPSIPRAMQLEKLTDYAKKAGLTFASFQPPLEAYLAAKRNASPHDTIFIGGSTFLVADILAIP